MKKLNYLITALILTISITCKKDNSSTVLLSPRSVNLADTLSIKMNETVFSGDFSIKLDSLGDSRCPSDAVCFWSGLADAKLIVKNGVDNQTIRLQSVPKADSTTVFNRQIKLLSVSPYPSGLSQIPQRDYVIKLLVK